MATCHPIGGACDSDVLGISHDVGNGADCTPRLFGMAASASRRPPGCRRAVEVRQMLESSGQVLEIAGHLSGTRAQRDIHLESSQ
jgi:hypothetical protein